MLFQGSIKASQSRRQPRRGTEQYAHGEDLPGFEVLAPARDASHAHEGFPFPEGADAYDPGHEWENENAIAKSREFGYFL